MSLPGRGLMSPYSNGYFNSRCNPIRPGRREGAPTVTQRPGL